MSSMPSYARIDGGETSDDRDQLIGDTICPWGEVDCNPCVNNVVDNFNQISDNHGHHTYNTKLRMEARDDSVDNEIMCLFTDPVYCELDEDWHIQGMARIPNLDENNWFVFTRSVNMDTGAFFAGQLTDMPSAGGHLGAAEVEDDSARQITEYYTMDMFGVYSGDLNHYGGLQMLGQYMFTGAECHDPGVYTGCNTPPSAFVFDFSDPSNVSILSSIDVYNLTPGNVDKVGTTASVKLYNGNYLVMTGDSDANNQYFFISDSDTLNTSTTWEYRESWNESELLDGGSGDVTWGSYQNLNFVTECGTGDIYLVGTNKDAAVLGDDWLDLFLVADDVDSNVYIVKRAQKHMYCDWCNYDASGNVYITPERNMVIYSSDKDDDDGLTGTGDILFEEFQNAYNQCNDINDDDCDYDGDGLTNVAEVALGTNKYLFDTDGDGLGDGEEANTYNTDPLVQDSDADGLIDGDEVNVYETDPSDPDSDGDSVTDGDEVENELDPNDAVDGNADNDGDGLTNAQEINDYNTDINNEDTDGDTLTDGFEVNDFGSDPNDMDSDDDDLTDENEYTSDTDPNDTDTDDDGLTDGDEVNVHGTDPTTPDSDVDGLEDGTEIELGTNPNDHDSDDDGLLDGEEVNTYNTDPQDADSDDDELNDYEEVHDYETDPNDSDSDDEGLLDGEEVLTYETDPLDTDTDDDQWSDYEEVNANIEKDPLKFDNLVQTTKTHDFDGDGLGDLIAFYPEGNFQVMTSTGDSFMTPDSWVTGLGDYSSIPLAGDFNGDGKDDIASFNIADGNIVVGQSNGSCFSNQGQWITDFGINSIKQLTGDFDGDGKDDVAVMTSEGNWSVAISSGSSFSNSGSWLSTTFADAQVLTGDFDEDGADDLLGFYPETGEIQVALSTGNTFSAPTTWLVSFGTDSTQYFVGDFDGNGQDDFIVYHDDGTFEVATSLGDSFQDRGTLGNGFPTDTNQLAVGDFTADERIDLVGYTIDENNVSWQNASWDVLVSNGSYFVSESDWEMETDGVMGYLNSKWDKIKENLRDFGSKFDSFKAKFSKKRGISL